MDVIERILGETEVGEFDEDDFGNFYNVLNELTAWRVREYLQSPNANKDVVAKIEKYIGSSVKSLTLGKVMHERGIIELLQGLNTGTILSYAKNNPDVYDKLQFLEENYNDVRPAIKPATAKDFKEFQGTIGRVASRLKQKGIPLTYPDVEKRVKDNSFMFYTPHTPMRSTNVSILHAKRSIWHMCYRGLDFDRYCQEHNIEHVKRRIF